MSELVLQKCSKCQSKKLLKFFKVKETTGVIYKTCISCCEKSIKGKKLCNCGRSPCFGFINDKSPTCCSFCKLEGMIDIRHNSCSCGRNPCFGFINDKSPTCCKLCKKDGMINIKDKKCSCDKIPHFGFINDKLPTCCASCKKEGMIDIKNIKCPCGVQLNNCKKCSNPLKIIIKNWLTNSKTADKKRNHYDANNFIDKDFCKSLIEDYKKCYYCLIDLQYIEYNETLATIERLNNDIGHIKSNCVIACRTCNFSKIGQKE